VSVMTDIRPALPAPARFAVPVGLGFLIGASFLVPIGTRAGVTMGHVILVALLPVPAMLLPWVLLLRAAGRAVRIGSRPMALIFAVLAAQFTWDFLFSPWPRLAPSVLGIATAGAVVYLARTRVEPVEPAVPADLVLT
jgi:hypothetical protein